MEAVAGAGAPKFQGWDLHSDGAFLGFISGSGSKKSNKGRTMCSLPNQVDLLRQLYIDNVWFQCLSPAQQKLVVYHDIMNPLPADMVNGNFQNNDMFLDLQSWPVSFQLQLVDLRQTEIEIVCVSHIGARSQPSPDSSRSGLAFLRSGQPIWLRFERRLLLGNERLRMLGLSISDTEAVEDSHTLNYASQHSLDLYSMSLGFAAALLSLKLEYLRCGSRGTSGNSH